MKECDIFVGVKTYSDWPLLHFFQVIKTQPPGIYTPAYLFSLSLSVPYLGPSSSRSYGGGAAELIGRKRVEIEFFLMF